MTLHKEALMVSQSMVENPMAWSPQNMSSNMSSTILELPREGSLGVGF